MLAADLQVDQPEARSARPAHPSFAPGMPTARGTRTIVGPREGVPMSTVDDGDQREHPQQPAEGADTTSEHEPGALDERERPQEPAEGPDDASAEPA